MRFFPLWCAVVYSTKAQQTSSYRTPELKSGSIPWITYTSTRSCTTRPSTIFVYTSNSSSFFLTHYGPSSAIEPVQSTSMPASSDALHVITSDSSSTIAWSDPFGGSPATSLPPFSATAGSTCPLPSTVTVSAPVPNDSCDSAAEKTVTSYVMNSCPIRNDSGITTSFVQSGTSEHLTTTEQTTIPRFTSNTILEGSASNATLVPVDFTLSKGDSANYCTSVMERTITIEHTIERTVSAPELESVYLSFTTLQGSSTIYRTSLSEHPASASRSSLGSISTSYSPVSDSSMSYRTSVLPETSGRDVTIYTTYKEASTVLSTFVIRQTLSPITITSTELQSGTTLYSVSTVPRTAVPITLTSTDVQDGSTRVFTSVITSTPEPLTSVCTETREGSTVFSISVSESTPDPLVVTYTEYSTRFVTSVIESTPEPLTLTSTIIGSGSLVYITSYIDRTPSLGVVTQTLTENGETIYFTTTIGTPEDSRTADPTTCVTEPPVTIFITKIETLMAPGDSTPASSLVAMPTSTLSMPASTTSPYTPQSSQDAATPANASVLTIVSTICATLDASNCAANSSVSTITSFVYSLDPSSASHSGVLAASNSSYESEQGLATRTVTSFIYGPSMTAGSTGELMVMTITKRETAICSFASTNGLSVRTVTSLVYPSSCDYRYTTRYAPEITVTRRGSTVTVYASTRTITAYATTLGNGTIGGGISRTDDSEPTPDPESDEDQPSQDSTSSEPSPTASADPVQPPAPVVAHPTELAQQGAASDPYVVAQVVSPEDNPPITPASNSSFLLVTFGSAAASLTTSDSSTAALRKRQTSQQSLTYNTTILFSSVAGGIYNLNAAATMAQNGNTSPSCVLSICVENMCGPSNALKTTFETYAYTYNSPSTVNNQAGVFSIRCLGQAYVGLDNVRVDPVFVPQPSASSSIPGVSRSSTAGLSTAATTPAGATTTNPGSSSTTASARPSVRTVTTSILSTYKTTAYATQTLVQTETAQAITITRDRTESGESFPHSYSNFPTICLIQSTTPDSSWDKFPQSICSSMLSPDLASQTPIHEKVPLLTKLPDRFIRQPWWAKLYRVFYSYRNYALRSDIDCLFHWVYYDHFDYAVGVSARDGLFEWIGSHLHSRTGHRDFYDGVRDNSRFDRDKNR